jgi:predicted RNA-binding Zn ribbon-like protein
VENGSEKSGVRSAHFQLIAGHPALDLVNTLDWRFREAGPEELIPTYDDLVRFTEQCGLLSSAQARRLIRTTSTNKGAHVVAEAQRMRETAARIFYAVIDGNDPPTEAIGDIERRYREAETHRHLGWSESHLVWEFSGSVPAPEFPLLMLAMKVVELLSSEDMSMIRACGNAECLWVFLDTSKNHTRRWCDMKICGNRMKARRFKAQQRG